MVNKGIHVEGARAPTRLRQGHILNLKDPNWNHLEYLHDEKHAKETTKKGTRN